ncbi:AbrB/MazE/SpoVT family DNA-binding domain-containing protein [Brevibacillus reuszeri]|uniref:AbrB/MazE/SpoVT family DNA-binding domain-containing protein n=1 Tax=Brevibacillus reuszeri TaxID=54915 RepID=UPI00289B6877|nr:AbrB/MazE/SpoVT family DNA-binding domain-containing protein [Brevibacillus reuszeri]
MDDIIIKTAPLTSKGQITIPQKVRELLEVSTHDTLRFIINTTTKQVTIEKQTAVCELCRDEKVIGSQPCFACDGTGIFDSNKSVLSFISQLQKYNIQGSIIWQNSSDFTSPLPFPLIKLQTSNTAYPVPIIETFQDFLQARSMVEHAGNVPFHQYDLDKLLDHLFVTEKARNTLKQKLQPETNAIFETFFGQKKK